MIRLFIASLFLTSYAGQSIAQTEGNDERFLNPFPETGLWSPLDGSKTGIFMEVQDGFMFGALFGFDSDGDDVWAIFSGALSPISDDEILLPDPPVGWVIEAELVRFLSGGCVIDCMPDGTEVDPFQLAPGTIRVEFAGRSEATFSVAGGPEKKLIPLPFGGGAQAYDPNQPLRLLPDLSGTWVVAGGSSANSFGLSSVIELGEAVVTPIDDSTENPPVFRVVSFPVVRDTEGIFPEDAFFGCSFFETGPDDPPARPRCSVSVTMSGIRLPFEHIGDSRLTAFELSDAVGAVTRLELFRLNYD